MKGANIDMYEIGMIVQVIDNIDPNIVTEGTIRKIEQDDELDNIQWLYILANDESLNIQYDPTIGNYWTVVASINDNIMVLSYPTFN